MTDPDIEVVTPQFERVDGEDPAPAPDGREEFEKLRGLDGERLEELGLRKWSAESDLYLFPGEWFDHIPEGFEVTSIHGPTYEFHADRESRDTRFGALAFGVEAEGNA